MIHPLLFTSMILFSHLHQSPTQHQHQQQLDQQPFSPPPSSQCTEKCGTLHIPFPFYLTNTSSCPSISPAFLLSCSNSSTLYLTIDSESYRVLEFSPDGVSVDFPDTTTCRQYNDLSAFGFSGNDHFGISDDNVIGLYDCEDSSLCKTDCEMMDLPGCEEDGNGTARASYPACCYPLSDRSSWDVGDRFSVFDKYGCRGFSCWVTSRGSNTGRRGVKLEWAVPRNSSGEEACAANALVVNATTVEEGVRCKCEEGFVGDGFAGGFGCLRTCIIDGREANGTDCYPKKRSRKMVTILAGVLGPIFVISSLIALLCLLKQPSKSGKYDPDQPQFHGTISFRKACRTRLFTYKELEDATKGFQDDQKLVETSNGTIYAGVLGNGSHVAVHKVQCRDEKDLIQVLSRVDVLSTIIHRNMASLLGCCIDCGRTPLVVYEYPAEGTLEELLHQSTTGHKVGLDWYKRLNISAETASLLAFLQHEVSPPLPHHDLKPGCLFLDHDLSVKVSGFRLLEPDPETDHHHPNRPSSRTDVYDFGLLLLEIITGSSKHGSLPSEALQRIRTGKLEEIVDPGLYYHEQPPFRKEQIEVVADLATRCLLFGGDQGKLGMVEVAKELVHITKDSIDGGSKRGPALEETFSNSSLLQMISMSPDSVYVP